MHHLTVKKGKMYSYYVCVQKLYPKNGKRCKMPFVSQELCDRFAWERLQDFFKSQKDFERILFAANKDLASDYQTVEEISAQLVDAEKQLNNLVEAVAAGVITKEVAGKKFKSLQATRAKLQAQLVLSQDKLSGQETTITKLEACRMWFYEYAHRLNNQRKRELIDLIVQRIEVRPVQKHHKAEYGKFPFELEITGALPMIFGDERRGEYLPYLSPKISFVLQTKKADA